MSSRRWAAWGLDGELAPYTLEVRVLPFIELA